MVHGKHHCHKQTPVGGSEYYPHKQQFIWIVLGVIEVRVENGPNVVEGIGQQREDHENIVKDNQSLGAVVLLRPF